MALQEDFERQGIWLFRYRGVLPVGIVLVGTALYLLEKLDSEDGLLEQVIDEKYYADFCLFVSFIGLFIRAYTVGFTPRNTSGRNIKEQVANTLNTTGIYSIVRHPLYLGNFFIWLGLALLTGNIGFIIAFCLLYWIYYERIMFAEEQYLRRKFGEQYTEWANNVPAFIPCFRRFVRPKLFYSWRKMLRNEKNGLLSVFLIFALLDVSGKMIQNNTEYNFFILYGCIFSIITYIVLKVLAKKTKMLDLSQ